MKKTAFIRIGIGFVLFYSFAAAHEQDTVSTAKWNQTLEINLYLMKDESILLPIYQTDRGKLHLEARYNYEDLKTFSAWIGYNIKSGNSFEYIITPMAGGVVGSTSGIAAGLELTFDFKGFEFYTEMEYIFDLKEKENDFYYNWTDITYAPKEWLWFGLSAQWTRLYKSDLEIERGLLVGGSLKQYELTGYLYNLGSDDFYIIFTLSANF
jgi:hypothetical protein